jgi:enoyl-CoA hydratase/carnithine racemase
VLLDRSGDELVVTLHRPEQHNAYSAAMRDALVDALDLAILAGLDVRLRGSGRSFCSGGDLAEFGTTPDPVTAHAIRTAQSAGRRIHQLRDRTTVEVHGACVGAGVELAAFAGTVEAHGWAYFQLPELRLGVIPGAGGTVSLPRRIGRHRTAWMALTGRRVDVATALEWGLVDRAC